MLNKRNYNLIDFDRATIQRNRLDFSKKQMRENYRSHRNFFLIGKDRAICLFLLFLIHPRAPVLSNLSLNPNYPRTIISISIINLEIGCTPWANTNITNSKLSIAPSPKRKGLPSANCRAASNRRQRVPVSPTRVTWNVIRRNLFHWKDDLLMYGCNAWFCPIGLIKLLSIALIDRDRVSLEIAVSIQL